MSLVDICMVSSGVKEGDTCLAIESRQTDLIISQSVIGGTVKTAALDIDWVLDGHIYQKQGQ